jgi:hypothetical protein
MRDKSSLDLGNSSVTNRESSLTPEAIRRLLFYLILGVAAALAALEIELSTTPEEATRSESQPQPPSQPERSQ